MKNEVAGVITQSLLIIIGVIILYRCFGYLENKTDDGLKMEFTHLIRIITSFGAACVSVALPKGIDMLSGSSLSSRVSPNTKAFGAISVFGISMFL